MKLNQSLTNYFNIIIFNAFILAISRIVETCLIVLNFGIKPSLFTSEILGFIYDLLLTNTFLIVGFPLFFLIDRNSKDKAYSIFIWFIVLLTVIHFFILKYFLYQLIPLDISIYKYSLKEILFTVNTSKISYVNTFLLLALLLASIYSIGKLLKKFSFSKRTITGGYSMVLLSIPLLIIGWLSGINFNNYSKSKSIYFFSNSLAYMFSSDHALGNGSDQYFVDFQQLYSNKEFQNTEYPLVHKFKNRHDLSPFFNRFNSAPNVVILIVEGLNDDFIHDYRDIQLMPFLSNLKDKSLYWNRCFTLGERSFAVVPSLLGSLPYGETGFTLLDKLPKHLSLVSILEANNYQTNFFYGQGSWFHLKDRFFQYNNIDLMFDNRKFGKKYDKIIVGDDNFFWGYNDKDLFNQSFEVIDTIQKKPRLDIFFTGTSHSPFVISDPDLYNTKFSNIRSELKNDSNVVFLDHYKKYIQSILFVDDALESFFKKYETRPDYDNTVFIITGDHPMTEIPISNSIKRYHVPLIIYSKNLKTIKTFTQSVSHLDFYESILSFLSDYQISVPEISTALGSTLISDESESDKRMAFMNDNREIIDYYSNNYFLSGENLFSVGNDLSLKALSDKIVLKKMQEELKIFKSTNYDVCLRDKIIPDSLYFSYLYYQLIKAQSIDTTAKEFNSEYYNFANSIAIKNGLICFNVSFDSFANKDNDVSLIIQLTTKNDSVTYWQSLNLTNDLKLFNSEIRIPIQNVSDSVLYFSTYLWNRNSKDFKFKNLKFKLYQK